VGLQLVGEPNSLFPVSGLSDDARLRGLLLQEPPDETAKARVIVDDEQVQRVLRAFEHRALHGHCPGSRALPRMPVTSLPPLFRLSPSGQTRGTAAATRGEIRNQGGSPFEEPRGTVISSAVPVPGEERI